MQHPYYEVIVISILYLLLAVITRLPDGVLLARTFGARCSAPVVPCLVTRAVTTRRPDGVS